jgi:hypothetical protein
MTDQTTLPTVSCPAEASLRFTPVFDGLWHPVVGVFV